MGLDHSSAVAKFQRAQGHLAILKNELSAWSKSNPYSATQTVSDDFSRHGVSLTLKKDPDLQHWSLIVGDCIHNLRSCLDHLVYAIACHEEGINPPRVERTIQFPIADDAFSFDRQKRRIESLSDGVKSAIARMQPYNRPHAELPPLLRMIRDMDDADKHRLIQVVIAPMQHGALSIPDLPPGSVVHPFATIGEFESGAEVLSFTVRPPVPNLKYDYDLAVTISIPHPPAPDGRHFTEIVAVLDWMIAEVDSVCEFVITAVSNKNGQL